MELRPYQQAAVQAIRDALNKGMKNPLVCLPTGSGKSAALSHLIYALAKKLPDSRMLILVHTQELIKQLAQTYERISGVKPGIYSASVGIKDHGEQVTFAQVQSFVRNKKRFNDYKLVVVDECDRIGPDENSNYQKLLADLRLCNPDLRVVGFTATPYRTSLGLVYGKDRIFDELVYDAGIKELIEQGYLCQLIGKAGVEKIDLSEIHIKQGEYVASELEDYMTSERLVAAAIREILKYASGRKKTLIFASGVKHAHMVSKALTAHDIKCPVITGDMPKEERNTLIQAFKDSTLSFLVNINVLSVGFDAPDIDMIVLLRPTKSPGLYYQQIGRGMRTHPGKKDCLILDLSGNISEHGPVDQLNERIKKKKKGQGQDGPLSKTCPACQSICALACKTCGDCGHVFVSEEESLVKHATKAYSDAPLSSPKPAATWHVCRGVHYKPHNKNTPCVWATYTFAAGASASDFLPLSGWGLARFIKLVKESEDITKTPRLIVEHGKLATTSGVEISFANISEWCYTLKRPTKVLVDQNGKYFNVIGRSYEPIQEKEAI